MLEALIRATNFVWIYKWSSKFCLRNIHKWGKYCSVRPPNPSSTRTPRRRRRRGVPHLLRVTVPVLEGTPLNPPPLEPKFPVSSVTSREHEKEEGGGGGGTRGREARVRWNRPA
jgi:hypothetical protein